MLWVLNDMVLLRHQNKYVVLVFWGFFFYNNHHNKSSQGEIPISSRTKLESKKGGKDQELIQSSTTLDPGYHMGK